MTRLKGRLNKIEHHFGGRNGCAVCRVMPPSGFVSIDINEDGSHGPENGARPCRGCGKRGPTTWIYVDKRPFPVPKTA